MREEESPQWRIREDADRSILLALCLRQLLGIRSPAPLPHLRGVPAHLDNRDEDAQEALERQWTAYWEMTVEPRAHTSVVPLGLVDGFDTLVALPVTGADELRAAITPLAAEAMALAQSMRARYTHVATPATSYRAYAGAIAEHERQVGRRAHSFDLTVQVLPFTQRGVWWIGALTVAVTDGLRQDVAAFDAAIHPIIADLA